MPLQALHRLRSIAMMHPVGRHQSAIPIMTFGRIRPRIAMCIFVDAYPSWSALVIWRAALAAAEDAEIAHRRSIERKTFTDAEIIDGFFKVTFGAEFHVAGGVDRIRKYDGPVRVYVDNRAQPDRSPQVGAVVADIRERIRDLDIAMTGRARRRPDRRVAGA